MNRITPFLQGLVALAFIVLTFALVARPGAMHCVLLPFASHGLGNTLRIGASALAAVAMLVSVRVPFLAFFAGVFAGLTAIVLGIQAALHDAMIDLPIAAGLTLGSAAIAALQPLGLRVLGLPKAADLPYEPVAEAWVVKTYGEGVWFESVRAGVDGTLYLAANIGLDFNRSDYYRDAHGEVIARRPDGSEQVLFKTPKGSAAGVFAVTDDGVLYMTSHGATSGIWRITPDGQGTLWARLPRGAWPNGLDFGPDGWLYSPDSSLGLVWRIDPASGKAEVAVEHPSLRARRFIALAPGANGLHFIGHDLIVTVSDSTEVLRFRMDATGRFAAPEVLATGIPGDDFAIGTDGSLFVTTHPYNTLVRIAPDGRRSIIADARQQIVGATDATFGRTEKDRDVLYVTTDGGAFNGGPRTRGQLVAVKPYPSR